MLTSKETYFDNGTANRLYQIVIPTPTWSNAKIYWTPSNKHGKNPFPCVYQVTFRLYNNHMSFVKLSRLHCKQKCFKMNKKVPRTMFLPFKVIYNSKIMTRRIYVTLLHLETCHVLIFTDFLF